MKTNRRGFLGLFGAGAVAGPSVLSTSLHDTLNVNVGGIMSRGMDPVSAPMGEVRDHISWAKKGLKKLIGKTAAEHHREKIRQNVFQYDANVATLRSVSLPTRIRMSRDRNYERSIHLEQGYLEGIINGWW